MDTLDTRRINPMGNQEIRGLHLHFPGFFHARARGENLIPDTYHPSSLVLGFPIAGDRCLSMLSSRGHIELQETSGPDEEPEVEVF